MSRRDQYNAELERHIRMRGPSIGPRARTTYNAEKQPVRKMVRVYVHPQLHERIWNWCRPRNVSMDSFTAKAVEFFLNYLENK